MLKNRKTIIAGGGEDRMRYIYRMTRRRGFITTESYLRLEVALGTTSNIEFNILLNAGTQRSTEQRLNITDTFTVTEMAMMVYKLLAGEAPETSKLRFFSNPFIFTGAGEANAIQNLYNGKMTIRVDSTTFIDSLDTARFERIGVAQEGLEVSTGVTNPAYGRSENPTNDYPFHSLTPTIQLSGASKNLITLSLPASANMAPAAGENVVVAYFRGFLNQNRASFKSNR